MGSGPTGGRGAGRGAFAPPVGPGGGAGRPALASRRGPAGAAVTGHETAAPPQDRALDRRVFLERMGLLTVAATTGTAFAPGVSGAYPAAGARTALRAGGWPLPDPRAVRAAEPWEMTVAELAALIRERALSPVELVEAYLRRIEALDGALLAFRPTRRARRR